jgi:Ca-activated chloride channel homolog
MRAYVRLSFGCIAAFSLCLVFALQAQDQNSTNPSEPVSVRVSVRDPQDRLIGGIKKERFRIYEDKIEQSITSFSSQSGLISLGLVCDISRSMKDNAAKMKAAITRLLRSSNAEDEYFLITFSESARIQPMTVETLQSEALIQKKETLTALLDAVYLGIDRLNQSKHGQKALIIISDGEDNNSSYSRTQVQAFAGESDVQVYAIGEQGMLGYGRNEIQKIVNLTGGRSFFPYSFSEIDYYLDLITSELHNQYLLRYSPTNKNHDGKWRKITVKLDAPPDSPKYTIRAREGRYAPKN